MYHFYFQCNECSYKWEIVSEDGDANGNICPNCGSDQIEIMVID